MKTEGESAPVIDDEDIVSPVKETIFKQIESFSHLIEIMVQGLRSEWVKVDMKVFGAVKNKIFLGIPIKQVCYGCAATNTLCELMQEPFTTDNVYSLRTRTEKVNYGISIKQLESFEISVDYLRNGSLKESLVLLKEISSLLKFDIQDTLDFVQNDTSLLKDLSPLNNDYTDDDLLEYLDYASYLKHQGY